MALSLSLPLFAIPLCRIDDCSTEAIGMQIGRRGFEKRDRSEGRSAGYLGLSVYRSATLKATFHNRQRQRA